jgi:dipeptidyl aminopeptidase/acylaminoacyl peptidase
MGTEPCAGPPEFGQSRGKHRHLTRRCALNADRPRVTTRQTSGVRAIMALAGCLVALGTPLSHADDAAIEQRVVNDGQVILQNVPPIPEDLDARLERYQRLTSKKMLDWTADGKALHVRSQVGDLAQILTVPKRGAQPETLTRLVNPVREVVRQYRGDLLAFTMNQHGGGNDQIYLLDPDNRTIRQLTDTPEALNNRMIWDRQDRRLAFRSNRRNGTSNDLWLMDIDRPEAARLILPAPDGALWKPVAFTRDGQRLLVQQYQGITDSRIHLLDLVSGELRELVGHAEHSSSNVAVGFDEEDNGAFFVSNLRDRSAEIGWVALDGEPGFRWVDADIPWDVTGFELSPDGRRGAFLTNEFGASQLYLFDPRRFSVRRVRGLPIGVASDLRFSANGRRLGFTMSTPTAPGDVWTLKITRIGGLPTRPRRWTSSELSRAEAQKLITPRLFSYPAAGLKPGETLYVPGFSYVPRGKGPHPVVIYIHGGPESQFRPSFNRTVQLWAAELGVAVLAPNVRGSLGYGRGYLALDDGMRREDAVHDIGALLDWIATRPDLDEQRVAVYGASYGGYMALASAVHYGDRLAAAVDRAGISNFVTYLENTADFRRDLRRFEYGDERIPEMRAFLERISPLNNVEKIRIPLLIAQGQNDPVVPASESEQMVRALRERDQVVWTMTALNEGHGYERKANRDLFEQVTWLFLEQHLLER